MSVVEHILPFAFVVLLWFGSTALVFWLDSRPPHTFASSLKGAGLIAIGSAALIALTIDDRGFVAAYLAFAGALAIWAWHEMSFLTGIVTGPNRAPCPSGLTGYVRFRAAAATLIHHEIALAVTALLLLVLAWGRANPVASEAFALLFALRLSAKLNIFLGVPAFMDEMLPPHLAYMRSYFTRAPMNPLFPLSLIASVAAAVWFGNAALNAGGGTAAGLSLLFGLAVLGVIEHLFLVLPLRDAALWRWARATSAVKTAAIE